jgi:ANTAR domain
VSPAPPEGSPTAAIETALRAAATVHGLRASCLAVLSTTTVTYERVVGGWGALRDGFVAPRAESMTARMLDGAPAHTSRADHEPSYLPTREVADLNVVTFVATPLAPPEDDAAVQLLLVGLDPAARVVEPWARALLRGLADGLADELARSAPGGAAHPPARGSRTALRRTRTGWVVESADGIVRPVGDLTSAMVMADLLADDLAPPGRPRRPDADLSETERLRLSVVQLEHALASRVVVEQAIGVLAERHGTRPRDAFERLRRTARGMGRRVHDLARLVVESAGDPRAALPGELTTARNSGGRPPGDRPAPPRPTAPRPAPHRR